MVRDDQGVARRRLGRFLSGEESGDTGDWEPEGVGSRCVRARINGEDGGEMDEELPEEHTGENAESVSLSRASLSDAGKLE